LLGKCSICEESSVLISGKLKVCLECIRESPERALEITDKIHEETRSRLGLPGSPPRDNGGISCGVCMNDCRIGLGKKGFCGLVSNVEGRLVRYGTPAKGILEWYYDPLPTNCVAEWFCPGCTGAGYPRYSYDEGAETGYCNLAVFYGSCSYDCLFCQNWHYRRRAAALSPTMSAENLASKAKDNVSCICYFGGDPAPQVLHAIRTSEIALEKAADEGRIMRICWESSGYFGERFVDQVCGLSLESGGIVKFDLKTFDPKLNRALCGVSNEPTLRNFERIGRDFFPKRPDLPLLTASTLLIPGYVDLEEARGIAEFISSIDKRIPYTLLAFYPAYVMDDLPTTRRTHAFDALRVAREAGLEHVCIGNIHLLV